MPAANVPLSGTLERHYLEELSRLPLAVDDHNVALSTLIDGS